MTDQKELLMAIGDIFTNIGMVFPYVEIKFRLAGKYGTDLLEKTLATLVEKKILNRFEFRDAIHYKSKEEIPFTLEEKKRRVNNGVQLNELANIVMEMAKAIGNPDILSLVDEYNKKYT